MNLQRSQGAFQGLDRVGSLGGQVLGGSATVRSSSKACSSSRTRSAPGWPAVGRLEGSAFCAWSGRRAWRGRSPAASSSWVGIRQSPPADRGWGLAAGGRLGSARRPGSGGSSRPIPRTTEPPQRSSGSALPQVMLRVGKLTERLLLGVVTTVPATPNRLPVAHDRSLSRSVRP